MKRTHLLAWTAGMMEARGGVTIHRQPYWYRGVRTFTWTVQGHCYCDEARSARIMRRLLGGGIRVHVNKGKPTRHTWRACTRQVQSALTMIEPYLVTRGWRERLETLRKFYGARTRTWKNRTPQYHARLEALAARMKEYNLRDNAKSLRPFVAGRDRSSGVTVSVSVRAPGKPR